MTLDEMTAIKMTGYKMLQNILVKKNSDKKISSRSFFKVKITASDEFLSLSSLSLPPVSPLSQALFFKVSVI